MIFCPKCGKQLEDNAKFCDGCGSSMEANTKCPKCGAAIEQGIAFCQNCGADLRAPQPAPVPQSAPAPQAMSAPQVMPTPAAQAPKKPLNKKPFIIGGIAVAAAGIITAAVALIVNNLPSSSSYALYVKDRELNYSAFKGNSEVVSENMFRGYSNSDASYYADSIGTAIYVNENKGMVFYPENIDNYSDTFTLYYRDLKFKNDPEKIDSDVEAYKVDEKVSSVLYAKYDGYNEYTFYKYNMKTKEKEKLFGGIESYQISSDGSSVFYSTNDGAAYIRPIDGEKKKIDVDFKILSYASDDLSLIVYINNYNELCKYQDDKKTRIDEDVKNILHVYDSGEIYYSKKGDSEDTFTYMDLVDDDMASADASVTEPQWDPPKSPKYSDFGSYNDYKAAYLEYQDAYKQYNTEYNEARDKYYDKQRRDNARENLKNSQLSSDLSFFCYYDGEKVSVLSESCYRFSYSYAENTPVTTFSAYDIENAKKVKMSKINEDIYNYYNLVQEAYDKSRRVYAAVKGTVTPISDSDQDISNGFSAYFDDDGTEIYYTYNNNQDYAYLYDLYLSKITDGNASEGERVETDITDFQIIDNAVIYTKSKGEDEDSVRDIYFNGEKIEENVRCVGFYIMDYNKEQGRLIYQTYKSYEDIARSSCKIYQGGKLTEITESGLYLGIVENGDIVYMEDYRTDKQKGTLMIFSNNKSEAIAEDVSNVGVDGSSLLYIADYTTSYKGDLYVYKNGKSSKVDEDVVTALYPSTSADEIHRLNAYS